MGQTLFHGLAFGALSASVFSLVGFALLDVCLGRQFTCRYVCPTGRLLGFMGRRSVLAVQRERELCATRCTACAQVCPLAVNPKFDQTRDCSLCGECLVACPAACLSIGRRKGR
jgi:ferredoxin-type protein NapH